MRSQHVPELNRNARRRGGFPSALTILSWLAELAARQGILIASAEGLGDGQLSEPPRQWRWLPIPPAGLKKNRIPRRPRGRTAFAEVLCGNAFTRPFSHVWQTNARLLIYVIPWKSSHFHRKRLIPQVNQAPVCTRPFSQGA